MRKLGTIQYISDEVFETLKDMAIKELGDKLPEVLKVKKHWWITPGTVNHMKKIGLLK